MNTSLDGSQLTGKEGIRASISTILDSASYLFEDNLTYTKEGALINADELEQNLTNVLNIIRAGEFNYTELTDVYEDLTLVEESLRSEFSEYGGGVINGEEVFTRLINLIMEIKLGMIDSPERLIKEEQERAQREIIERTKQESELEKEIKDLNRLITELKSLLAEIGSGLPEIDQILKLISLKSLTRLLEARGTALSKEALMEVLEENFLKALIEIEKGGKDSHIFKNHGEDLTIEEMNRILEAKGRNPNKNRNFQSKFYSNIYVARAIIQNLAKIQSTIAEVKAKFERFHEPKKDHRGRVIQASEEGHCYAQFKENIGLVYTTLSRDDGTTYVDQTMATESNTTIICIRYVCIPQEVDGKYTEGYKLSIETMYPVIVK